MTLTFREGPGCAKGKLQRTQPGFHDWNLRFLWVSGWAWWLKSDLFTVFHTDPEPDYVLHPPSTGSHHSTKLWDDCAVWDSAGCLHPGPASPPQWCLCPSDLYKHQLAWEHSKSFCFSSAQVLGLPDRWAERPTNSRADEAGQRVILSTYVAWHRVGTQFSMCLLNEWNRVQNVSSNPYTDFCCRIVSQTCSKLTVGDF